MPRTVDEGFRDFLPRLTPSSSETEAAKRHRASIEQCIRSNFGLNRFWRIGSFGNGTSISGYSDVDYMASIPRKSLAQNSSSTLTKLRGALATRFPNTGVRTSCPAVIVPFGTDAKETTEVTPADYVRAASDFSIYDIPDCAGGWMEASPDAHIAYVRSLDSKMSSKVKPLIRFIKAWKYFSECSNLLILPRAAGCKIRIRRKVDCILDRCRTCFRPFGQYEVGTNPRPNGYLRLYLAM